MKRYFSLLALAGMVVVLTGCAGAARTDQMIAHSTPQQRIAKTPFKANIAVKEVSGGKETNPMWASNVGNGEFELALEESLRDAGLLSGGKQLGKYTLIAHMEKLDQPLLGGFSMTVTATVNYVLVERATNKEVLNKKISLPFTATMGDTLSGVERLRIANEGSVRVNIASLIDELTRLGIDSVAMH